MTINLNNSKTSEQRYIEVDDQQTSVPKEKYLGIMRPLWAEQKRKKRATRCRDERGKRCMKSCRECSKFRDGGDLSLDKFSEDGFDVADTVDIAELVADKLLLEQLFAALNDTEKALIVARYYDNRTVRDYAAEVGVSHQAISKQERKILEKLRKLIKE